ncbi:hypothetical protein [Rahnella sp. ChDrAdgB13]|uniref:hypothetical protein n=1 Tax=Rahnella sp. ChDrAdgB13 TaxID=1850581 RepID=UPI001AD88D25|nr:hypothetical protein [Rahnella sp. ChDrAdgB13]
MNKLADLMINNHSNRITEEQRGENARNASNYSEFIIHGMKSVSSVMFWAASNKNYSGERSKNDMENIALLIDVNMNLLEKLIEIECARSGTSHGVATHG